MSRSDYEDALKAKGFSSPQAAQFAATYTVLSTFSDATGFTATLFQKTGSTEKILAIAGTNGPLDFLTDIIDVAVLGTTALQAQYTALQNYYIQLQDELKLLPGEHVTVTGHSLGGFLAQAFSVNHADTITHAYTYNAPGIGGVVAQVLELIGVTSTTISTPLVTNIEAQAGPSAAAGLGTLLGTPEHVFIEGTLLSPLNNHSIEALTDALAIYDLLATIDPSLNQNVSGITDILTAASSNPFTSLENALDGLRKVFLGSNVTLTAPDDREAYYTNLLALKSNISPVGQPLTGYTITSLVNQSNSSVFSHAKAVTTEGQAYRYALTELNSFVVLGADYSLHNPGGALDLYDANTGHGTWTALALSDRAELLAKRLAVNVNDGGTVATDTHYLDVRTGFEVGSTSSTSEVIFGDDRVGDVLIGHAGDDHLYGRDGADTIEGNGGSDYIEGGAGNDPLLSGGAGNDIILGQQGNDTLYGGADNDRLNGGLGNDTLRGDEGADQYTYFSGQGQDTINDTDKVGSVLFDRQVVAGGLHRHGEPDNTWTSLDGRFTFVKQEETKLVINNTLTIENFDFTTGALGIHLAEAPNTATPAVPEIDFSHPFPTTTYTFDDEITVAFLNGISVPGNDPLIVFANGGDDRINIGGDKNQVVFGGQGHDALFDHEKSDVFDEGQDAAELVLT